MELSYVQLPCHDSETLTLLLARLGACKNSKLARTLLHQVVSEGTTL